MEMKEIESAVEGILFASGEPVQTERICTALELDPDMCDGCGSCFGPCPSVRYWS